MIEGTEIGGMHYMYLVYRVETTDPLNFALHYMPQKPPQCV